jgi:hypothetical protein
MSAGADRNLAVEGIEEVMTGHAITAAPTDLLGALVAVQISGDEAETMGATETIRGDVVLASLGSPVIEKLFLNALSTCAYGSTRGHQHLSMTATAQHLIFQSK